MWVALTAPGMTEGPEVSGGPWLHYVVVGQPQKNPELGARVNLTLSPSYSTPKMSRPFLAQSLRFPIYRQRGAKW